MYQNIVPAGADTSAGLTVPTGIQIGMGTRTSSVEKLFQQGNFTQTDNQSGHGDRGQRIFPGPSRHSAGLYPRRQLQGRPERKHSRRIGISAAASNLRTENGRRHACRSYRSSSRPQTLPARWCRRSTCNSYNFPNPGRTPVRGAKLFHSDRRLRVT